MKSIICRLFHFKHWEFYNTYYGKAPWRMVICSKCNHGLRVKLGKEVE